MQMLLKGIQRDFICTPDPDASDFSRAHKRVSGVVADGNEQLFATKYKLYLPTEEELRAEIETQKAIFYLQQQKGKDADL